MKFEGCSRFAEPDNEPDLREEKMIEEIDRLNEELAELRKELSQEKANGDRLAGNGNSLRAELENGKEAPTHYNAWFSFLKSLTMHKELRGGK